MDTFRYKPELADDHGGSLSQVLADYLLQIVQFAGDVGEVRIGIEIDLNHELVLW